MITDTKILTPLVVEDINYNGDLWRIHKDFVGESRILNGALTVPTGFVTDFGSIPRIAWPFIAKNGPWDAGTVFHDWLYENLGKVRVYQSWLDSWQELELTRKDADMVLLEFMEFMKVEEMAKTEIYRAVRTFGRSHWRK
jgi:hypothetical protein